jgi:polyhydroxybutyrate depolymerase
MTGKDMAAFTGLARRGPEAGFVTVFPDGWKKVWEGAGPLPGRSGVDDPEFLRALVAELRAEALAEADHLFLVGISNGALFTEHVARHGLVRVTGIVLVAGTTSKASRDTELRPTQSAAVLCFAGTGDPVMPYEGGPIGSHSLAGLLTTLRAWQRGEKGDSRIAVGPEQVCADWAAANGHGEKSTPVCAPGPEGDLRVETVQWVKPGRQPVLLYRIERGGHGWPGGPQMLPTPVIGPISAELDATGILLDMARKEIAPGGSAKPNP